MNDKYMNISPIHVLAKFLHIRSGFQLFIDTNNKSVNIAIIVKTLIITLRMNKSEYYSVQLENSMFKLPLENNPLNPKTLTFP